MMSIKHVSLEPGSLVTDECVGCGERTLIFVTVYAMTDDGVQEFGTVDRCLTCEPLGESEDAS